MLEWLRVNKDALVAIAALLSPLIAVAGTLMAAVVSYRAVTTGPIVQREIAHIQLDLQERTARATLLGAADQKWIEDFRGTLAELLALYSEVKSIELTEHTPADLLKKKTEGTSRLNLLRMKLPLIIEFRDPAVGKFATAIDSLSAAGSEEEFRPLIQEVATIAIQIIARKQEHIAARIRAVERDGLRITTD